MPWAIDVRKAGPVIALGVNGRWIEVEIHRRRVEIEWGNLLHEAEAATDEARER